MSGFFAHLPVKNFQVRTYSERWRGRRMTSRMYCWLLRCEVMDKLIDKPHQNLHAEVTGHHNSMMDAWSSMFASQIVS